MLRYRLALLSVLFVPAIWPLAAAQAADEAEVVLRPPGFAAEVEIWRGTPLLRASPQPPAKVHVAVGVGTGCERGGCRPPQAPACGKPARKEKCRRHRCPRR
jgi:hypothetical protein